MKKLLIVAMLFSVFCLKAQDTIDVTDMYYMFNAQPDNGYSFVKDNYGTIPGLESSFGSWVYPIPFENGLGQKFEASKTVVYGVAITMEPRWVIKSSGMKDDTLRPISHYSTHYRAVLFDSAYAPLDSVWLDTLSIIKRRSFKYQPTVPEASEQVVPVYEFYFDRPLDSTHVLDGEFYAGRSWRPRCVDNSDEAQEGLPTKYFFPLEYFGHSDFDEGDYNFYRLLPGGGITGSLDYLAPMINVIHYDMNESTFDDYTWPGNPWGFFFPITGLRCSAMKGVELTEQGQYYARLGWSDAQEGGEYALRIMDSTGSTVLKDTVADTTYMLASLTPGMAYRAELRKSCRYNFTNDTTVLWGDPVTLLFAMEPEPGPVDTTTTDTTVVDTTGIRMVLVGDADFSLRPNPAGETAVVTMQYAVAERAELTLLDMQGRVVRRRTLPAGTRTATLELGGLPSGAYLLKVVTPQGLATRRLLKR